MILKPATSHEWSFRFLIEILGDKGKHARSAIGTNTLPFDTPVEIELILKLKS